VPVPAWVPVLGQGQDLGLAQASVLEWVRGRVSERVSERVLGLVLGSLPPLQPGSM
jgi:hypothetical protein